MSPRLEARGEPDSTTAARARVLVIDDEPMMLRAIQRLLEAEHDVTSTTDPVDAIDRIRAGTRFDAILCDVLMPAMTGIEVYDALVRIAPDQARRVVFMTGGAFAPQVSQFLDSIGNARIEKPLDRSALRAAIRAHLTS